MVGKALLLATYLSLPGVHPETKINSPITERICTFHEKVRDSTLYIITQCNGLDPIPLEGEIPGEKCYINPETLASRICEAPDTMMDCGGEDISGCEIPENNI